MSSSIPADYGAIAGVVAASFVVHHIYMPFYVVKGRKKYKIKAPDLYASSDNCKDKEAMNAFNCIQRGHQNSLEYQPAFLALLATAGLKYPRAAAALGMVNLVGRVIYFKGYSTGNPNWRTLGMPLAYIAMFGLAGMCVRMCCASGGAK